MAKEEGSTVSYIVKTFDNSYGQNPPELDELMARDDIQIHAIHTAGAARRAMRSEP